MRAIYSIAELKSVDPTSLFLANLEPLFCNTRSMNPHSHLDIDVDSFDMCCAVLCCAKLLQSYLTLCNLMDCSPPGSSICGILQARIQSGLPYLPPGDLPNPGIESRSLKSSALASRFFTTSATWEALFIFGVSKT